MCSHRGPVTYQEVRGRLEERRGSGGLVTALSALPRLGGDVTWLACALSDLDREVARGRRAATYARGGVQLLDFPVELHRAFYDDACVTGLGFLFHGLFDQVYGPVFDHRFRRGWDAYQQVNRCYADGVAQWAHGRPVFVEDYHLMLVAHELQAMRTSPVGPLAYFHHVPWCPPEYFAFLPRKLRGDILAGVLAFDTLGFHARRWAEAFLACCDAFLPGAECTPDAVVWRGRQVPVVVAPAQIDVAGLRERAAGRDTQSWRRRIAPLVEGRRVVARVDRVDLWKNMVRGFWAFEQLAATGGDDDLVLLALLARSRMHLPEYRKYLAACIREARRVDERLRAAGRGRIHLAVARHSDHSRALAVLGCADVVLVNPTSDGLNLVAKESVVAGEGRGRLVLSETAGVYEEIGRWAHAVNPFDIDETATAIGQALASDRGDPSLRDAVDRNAPHEWLRRRLAAVNQAPPPPA